MKYYKTTAIAIPIIVQIKYLLYENKSLALSDLYMRGSLFHTSGYKSSFTSCYQTP